MGTFTFTFFTISHKVLLLLVFQCWLQISAEFRNLHADFREVISDISRRMGSGMLVYYLESPDTAEQWDEVPAAFCSV